jgi:uncharacterized protein (TIGR03118 family)
MTHQLEDLSMSSSKQYVTVMTKRRLIRFAMTALLTGFGLHVGGVGAQSYPTPMPDPTPMPTPTPTPAPTPAPTPPATPSTFVATPLVSNGAMAGTVTDPSLINPWGLAASSDGPIWVANNATQTSTAYDGAGTKQIAVSIPAGTRGLANPTGVVFNGTTDFAVSNGSASAPATFIFDGEGGTVLAWSPNVSPATATIAYDDGTGGAVYKGLALAANASGSFLYATDFHNAKVDVFDAQFHKVSAAGGFVDPALPTGFAPFGIQAVQLGTTPVIVVTYAQHTTDTPDEEVKGPGMGFANVFDTNGTLLMHLSAPAGNLNAPWGVALAPANFGSFSNMLLVGNFGDGVINAFDPTSGAFVDTLKDAMGQPIAIDGLWGLLFGNGTNNQPATTLYFAAGIADEAAGLYGHIDVSP